MALAECALAGDLGADVELEDGSEARVFGETVGSFVVSGASAALAGLDCTIIGTVGGARLRISAGSSRIDLGLERLREAHAALAALLD